MLHLFFETAGLLLWILLSQLLIAVCATSSKTIHQRTVSKLFSKVIFEAFTVLGELYATQALPTPSRSQAGPMEKKSAREAGRVV